MNRRSFLKKLLGGFLTFVGLGGGAYCYAHNIEPSLLTIQRETLKSAKIPAAFNGFKIVQFTDTHIGYHYTINQFSELVDTINQQKPDLILFTGDLVDRPDNYEWGNDLVTLLQHLQANCGKYWIYGNHDHGGYGSDVVKKVMDRADFKLLQNDYTEITTDQRSIVLAGIDDVMLGRPDLEYTLAGADPALFTLLLAHEPDYADNTAGSSVDVQLSGHSHGGQVRLPFFGHLYTPLYAQKYVDGKYHIDDGNLTLYVSRGIGTTRLPYRFLCKPEIQVYTLEPAA